jgi:hypothetical protein
MIARFSLSILFVAFFASENVALGQELRNGDIVHTQKVLLLQTRERLLSKVRRQQQKDALDQPRGLQTMICSVCPTPETTIPLNEPLLEDINEYIRNGEGNSTEILFSFLKEIDATYSSKFHFPDCNL